MDQDRPLFGVLLMLGFCGLAPFGDSLAKLLGGQIPLAELVLVRFSLQALFLLPVIHLSGTSLRCSRRVFRLTAYRTFLHILGTTFMYSALLFLPLADAIAIAFVMPFIMLVLGKTVLKEEVGTRRIIASIVGFGGTLMVIQPSFATVGLPALLPVAVAVVFALFMLVTRQIAKEIDPVPLQALSGLMAMPVMLLVVLGGWIHGDIFALSLVLPDLKQALLLVMIGLFGTLAHLLMTWSLRFAPSATLAPMQYLEIPMATFLGWLLFSDLPNGMAAVGIAVTIGAGLYVIYREQRIAPGAAPLA